MTGGTALLIVDVQNDFCTGGSLAVPQGERVVGPLNHYIDDAVVSGAPVYASRDWHPPVSTHFKPFGGRWPVHCVRETSGARFHPDLRLPPNAIVVTKGTEPDEAGYSAFDGRTQEGRQFLADLRERGVGHLMVGGLATDYCVRWSVLDALSAGIRVTVLEDAIAGVDADDSARALAEMRARGAQVTSQARVD